MRPCQPWRAVPRGWLRSGNASGSAIGRRCAFARDYASEASSSSSSSSSSTSASSSTNSPPEIPSKAIIFSGIQPTGIPHIGNYLGALQEWVRLQQAAGPDVQLLYSVVDLHALTKVSDSTAIDPHAGDLLRRQRREMLASLLAVGLDPDRCALFYQSAVPSHSELHWLLSTTASVGYLSRMTQWKSKLQLSDDASPFDDSSSNKSEKNSRSRLKLGLFSYPVLMAADVLVHRASHIPVGEDQCQHLEFARELANGFNHVHGTALVPPTTILSPARRIMSLQAPHQKMSKSHADPRSRILLTDDPKSLRKKIMSAVTDSTNSVSYDPVNRPGVANLLELLALVEGTAVEGAASSHKQISAAGIAEQAAAMASEAGIGGQPLKVLKTRLADALVERLEPIRTRFADVLSRDDGRYLDRVAEHGAKKARANAEATMEAVREKLGL